MKKNNKILRVIWSFFEIIIIVYVVLMTSFIVFKNKYGYTQINNYTFYNVDKVGDKNNSRLKKGNLVIIEKTNDIKKGDMIYYYAIYDESYIVRSDKVKDIIVSGSDTMYVVHRDGDDVSVFDSKVLGKKGFLYPHLGMILTVVCSRLGFILLVFLPITIVFLYQVYDFITVIRREKSDNDNSGDEEEDDDEPVIIESHDAEEDEDNNKEDEEKSDDKSEVAKKEEAEKNADEKDNNKIESKKEVEDNKKKDEEKSNDKTEIAKKEEENKNADEKDNNKIESEKEVEDNKKKDEEKSNDKSEIEKKEEDDKKKNDKKDKKFDVEVL